MTVNFARESYLLQVDRELKDLLLSFSRRNDASNGSQFAIDCQLALENYQYAIELIEAGELEDALWFVETHLDLARLDPYEYYLDVILRASLQHNDNDLVICKHCWRYGHSYADFGIQSRVLSVIYNYIFHLKYEGADYFPLLIDLIQWACKEDDEDLKNYVLQVLSEDFFFSEANPIPLADEIFRWIFSESDIIFHERACKILTDFLRQVDLPANALPLWKILAKAARTCGYEKFRSDAISLKPDYVRALMDRGLSYENKEMYEEAVEVYDIAIQLDPENSLAYTSRVMADTVLKCRHGFKH